MPGKKLLVAAFVFLFSCCSLMVRGQQLHAVLNGTVTDAPGAVIPNPPVTVTQREGNTTPRTVTTDARGNYSISDLPAANYDLKVSASGFETFSATNITLFVAQTRTVDAKLVPG